MLLPRWVGLCVRLGVSSAAAPTPTGVFNQRFEVLLPCLKLWVIQSVLLPSCSSQFICTWMWDHPVHNPPPHQVLQLPPCCSSSLPSCPSLPLPPVWMNVSSLTLWLSDFHRVWFSVSSGFLFLNLLSFFWLCEEAQCVYLCLHLGQKSHWDS